MSEKSLEGLTPEQIEASAAMYQSLVNNPETRELTLRATKKVNPALSIPEVELKDMARGEFTKRDEKIAKLEADILKRDAEQRVKDARASLKDKGFAQTDVDAIEKIMVDRQIPNYETAAEFYRNSQKVAEPTPATVQTRPSTFTMPNDPLGAMKGGRNGLNRWAREEGAAAINDLRNGRVKLPH